MHCPLKVQEALSEASLLLPVQANLLKFHLTALGDVYDVTNEDDMSAYAATLDLTTLMDNLSNAGVPDEVITYVLSGGSNSDAEDVTDENASEAESDAESAEAGAA